MKHIEAYMVGVRKTNEEFDLMYQNLLEREAEMQKRVAEYNEYLRDTKRKLMRLKSLAECISQESYLASTSISIYSQEHKVLSDSCDEADNLVEDLELITRRFPKEIKMEVIED